MDIYIMYILFYLIGNKYQKYLFKLIYHHYMLIINCYNYETVNWRTVIIKKEI